jgi:hypothetical protein
VRRLEVQREQAGRRVPEPFAARRAHDDLAGGPDPPDLGASRRQLCDELGPEERFEAAKREYKLRLDRLFTDEAIPFRLLTGGDHDHDMRLLPGVAAEGTSGLDLHVRPRGRGTGPLVGLRTRHVRRQRPGARVGIRAQHTTYTAYTTSECRRTPRRPHRSICHVREPE